ncbi:malonyl-CoA decarboxylase [Luminiphilus sp.]|nr:malonyl-CoA decarboxylase [Luminiphilus sp.]MDB3918190.1 malonyl-CoA decarboxylase [Luminiphilus sp.]
MSGENQPPIDTRSELSTSGFSGLLASVINAGRDILSRRRQATAQAPSEDLLTKCRQLLHHRGEASGLALACEVMADYQALDLPNKIIFFEALARDFGSDSDAILAAADRYKADPSSQNLADLSRVTEASRVKLFRRMNMAPNATPLLVKMRGTLLNLLSEHSDLKSVDTDLKHQFVSWFNRGFLELRVIDWNSPAAVLEKIIEYESVHAIQGWDDLRSRLRDNRMCFAFFHPAMPDDPLVFVEVALTAGVPSAIAPLIDKTAEPTDERAVDTVVFYSISNCHPGLAGVSFGNFLIKQVVEEVGKRYPKTKRYVTLSPVPGFCRWLTAQKAHADLDELRALAKDQGRDTTDPLWESLVRLCAQYLSSTRDNNLAIDPVARFHLGNGASLHAIHWAADVSEKGLNQSVGIMVNYLYDLSSIEENHDAYFDQGEIAMSRMVAKWVH